MTSTLLFLCPHGAAKSLLAATYAQQMADQAGLELQCTFAGTEPDAQLSPAVVELLRNEGLEVVNQPPRRVTPQELASAFQVVSLGCRLDELLSPGVLVEQWDDVPLVSQNLGAARESIRRHVEQLIGDVAQTL
jgi:protein-tyrosine-phosphatase